MYVKNITLWMMPSSTFLKQFDTLLCIYLYQQMAKKPNEA